MRIAFTFRHLDSSESLKGYATDKLSKMQRYLHAPLDIEVTFAVERHLHTVDVHLVSGPENYRGRESSQDMYASIDLVVDKIRAQLNTSKGGQRSQRRRASSPGVVAAEMAAEPTSDSADAGAD